MESTSPDTRLDLRSIVIAVGVVLGAVGLCVGSRLAHLPRRELFALGAFMLVCWLPLALVRTRRAFVIASVAWTVVMVVAFMFVPLAVPFLLPLVAAGFVHPHPDGGRALRMLGAGLVLAVVVVVGVGFTVFPDRGTTLRVCFDRVVADEVGKTIYSTHSSRGWDFRPGIVSYGGALGDGVSSDRSFTVEFEPFADPADIADVIRLADADPDVAGHRRDGVPTGRC